MFTNMVFKLLQELLGSLKKEYVFSYFSRLCFDVCKVSGKGVIPPLKFTTVCVCVCVCVCIYIYIYMHALSRLREIKY